MLLRLAVRSRPFVAVTAEDAASQFSSSKTSSTYDGCAAAHVHLPLPGLRDGSVKSARAMFAPFYAIRTRREPMRFRLADIRQLSMNIDRLMIS